MQEGREHVQVTLTIKERQKKVRDLNIIPFQARIQLAIIQYENIILQDVHPNRCVVVPLR
jgi:hypothetical protein